MIAIEHTLDESLVHSVFSVKYIQPIIKQQLSSFQIYICKCVRGRRIHRIPQFSVELLKVNTL